VTKETALVPIEQKEVQFYGDELIAIRGNDGQIYVAIGQMCDALGLDRASQARRIRSDEVLVDGYQGAVNLTYPDGGTQPSGVLRVDLVPLWLTGIRIKAVRDDIRPKLKRFKKEAAKVLWEAFQEGRLTSTISFEELLETDSPAVQAYRTVQALLRLAESQVLLEARVEDHDQRLELIEAALGDSSRHITESQATQISQAIRAIALTMSTRSGKNEYGRCWGEFYRKFGVSKYRHLPDAKFDEAMTWLTQWHQELTGDVPF
jgi:hypothetical protein